VWRKLVMMNEIRSSAATKALLPIALLAGCNLGGVGPGPPDASGGPDPAASMARRVDEYMAPFVEMHDFSGAVLVAHRGKVVVRRAYGYADRERRVPVTPATVFGIGSVTKTFTAAAIEFLADRGRLSLADPLSKFFPEFPRGGDISLAQILAHTSGIPDYYDLPEYAARRLEPMPPAAFAALVGGKPLDFQPGTASHYSNSGYRLLASVVEKASGVPYADFLRTEFFAPLGMKDTGDLSNPRLVPRLALGYDAGFPPEHVQRAAPVNPTWLEGNGALHSTVDDLLRWANAVRTERFVHASSLPLPYGYGWGSRRRFDRDAIEQTGRVPIGYVSYLAVYPAEDLEVVVLGNLQVAVSERIGIDLAAMVLGAPVLPLGRRPAPGVPSSAEALAPFAGRYEIAPGFVLTVSASPRGLSLAGPDGAFLPLDATSPPRFFFRPLYVDVTFERDTTGRVVSLDWGGQVKAKRLP
jgi:CubicO group peptidase (beta-lactamase class C family)